MNNLLLHFDDLFSNLQRQAVWQQFLALLLAFGLWLVLKSLLKLEQKTWSLPRPFAGFATLQPLANELLLWLFLAIASRSLDALTGVAGLALFFNRYVAAWVLSRVAILFARKRFSRVVVQRTDLQVVRPLLVILGVLGLYSQFNNVDDLWQISVFNWGGNVLSFGSLLLLIFGFYFLASGTAVPAWCLAWIARRLFRLSNPAYRASALLIRYLIVGLGLVFILAYVGVNTTLLAAVGGGLSVGLGFGLKEIFSNFISGLWLLLEGSVRPGDVLLLESDKGGEDPCEVLELGMRATTLWRDRDNVELVVPNQTFFTQSMVTYSGIRDTHRRGQVLVGAAYHHPPEQVIALLEATALEVSRVLPEPKPKGLLLRYDDSCITYGIRYWIHKPMDGVSVASEVGIAVWKAFQREGIEIPFPQRVVAMKPGPASP